MGENGDKIKRGVDFETRVGESSVPRQVFFWRPGKRFNHRTFFLISVLWLMNFFIVLPVLSLDLSKAYYSSIFLVNTAKWVKGLTGISENLFFQFLTFWVCAFTPVSFYLFARRLTMRHEITAFIATLFFILPSPLFGNLPIVVTALLRGDGAHMVVFSFLPLFMLYLQMFLSTGASALLFLTAVTLAYSAVVSLFATFNIFVFLAVILIAEGFLGDLRIKILRTVILVLTASALTLFWYYPKAVLDLLTMPVVNEAAGKFLNILPLSIPIIPVAGALAFLIFDRRIKLRPVFVSLALLLVYVMIYGLSGQLSLGSIFRPDRYMPEIAMVISLMASIVFVLMIETGVRHFKRKAVGGSVFFGIMMLISFTVSFGIMMVTHKVENSYDNLSKMSMSQRYYVQGRDVSDFEIGDVSRILGSGISIATFLVLLYFLRKYPTAFSKSERSKV